MTKMYDDLRDMVAELYDRFPPGFPYERDSVRLGIACLEDEMQEVYEEWRHNKRHLGNCVSDIRVELLQVAAVAMMMVDGIDKTVTESLCAIW
jgi:NTP pyrophosphatase (non-canonical NTP hydrolase)